MKFRKVSPRPNFPEMEKKTLAYWEENKIFNQSLEKPSLKGEFVFYEGPPTANGRPGLHHIEARAFKDLFPRYKTMMGYHVARRAGWDTHGLPVELEVEKNLGFSGKRDIETYGIEKFNKKCAESVWKYKEEWEKLTKRIGYWIDLDNPYITCSNEYIESVWSILKKIWEKGLLYQGYKVVPYCPRCGTTLSSHEVAQGYRRVEEESVYAKFKLKTQNLKLKVASQLLERGENIYFLAWTTTPWTLPGNVALALGGGIDYVLVRIVKIMSVARVVPSMTRGSREIAVPRQTRDILRRGLGTPRNDGIGKEEYLILAKKRLEILDGDYEIIQEFKGKDLAGIEYEALYPVFEDYNIDQERGATGQRSCKGESLLSEFQVTPFRASLQKDNTLLYKAPIYQTVLADFVNTEDGTGIVHTAVMYGEDDYELGKKLGLPMQHTVDLQGKFNFNLKSQKSKVHPSREITRKGDKIETHNLKLKVASQLLNKIEGKFVKDAEKDIIEDLQKRNLLYKSQIFEHEYPFCWRCKTPLLYYAKESWFIAMSKMREKLVENNEKVNWIPKYLKEGRFGKWIAEARDWAVSRERYWGTPMPIWICRGGKSQIQNSNFQINSKSKIQNFKGCGEVKVIGSIEELKIQSSKVHPSREITRKGDKTKTQNSKPLIDNELHDLHRPYIDEITFKCEKCGGEMRRVSEVLDCWFDSGSMPFAGANGENDAPELFPADFICEAVDQTRGWFYTLLAIATLLDFGPAYKNVISLGHLLDQNGQKMSKSKGNIIDPNKALDDFSADSIRWFFYSVNQPADAKNFDPANLRDIISRFILTLWNSYSFFLTYASIDQPEINSSRDPLRLPLGKGERAENILDQWIISRLADVNNKVVQYLDNYNVLNTTYEIEGLVDDLSNWYIRRSRRRFWKSEDSSDKQMAYETLHFVLVNLSRMIAPLMPFLAEEIYRGLTGKKSVHLEGFPVIDEGLIQPNLNERMEETRRAVNLGLKLRAEAKVKVRQVLCKLKMKNEEPKVVSKAEPLKTIMKNEKFSDLIIEEVNVREIEFVDKIEEEKGWIIDVDGDLEMALDTRITPELKREMIVRELVRAIQEKRKNNSLEVSDRIELALYTKDQEILAAIREGKEYIQKETLAEHLGGDKLGEIVKIEGKEVLINVVKSKSY